MIRHLAEVVWFLWLARKLFIFCLVLLHRSKEVVYCRSLVLLVKQGGHVDINMFQALIVRVLGVFDFLDAVMRIPLGKSLDVSNMQVSVIFVDSVDSCHIIHIQEVEALLD